MSAAAEQLILIPATLLIAMAMFGAALFTRFLRVREAERKEEREIQMREVEHNRMLQKEKDEFDREMQREQRQLEREKWDEERNEKFLERHQNDEEGRKAADTPRLAVDGSGYIFMNMPNDQKPLFQDLLRGFEDFARVKGYSISFDYDGSMSNRVAFRFTILEDGVSVSSARVKRDLTDYMNRVKSGNFDDIDMVIPETEHLTMIMMLKNRLGFLQQSYTAQKNTLEFYEKFLRNVENFSGPFTAPQFFIQGAGAQTPSNYLALNSSQVAQGREIALTGNTSSQQINIGDTFAEREGLINKLNRLASLLEEAKNGEKAEKAKEAQKLIEKTRDEIKDEPKPDESRLKKYLERAKELFATATFAKEACDGFAEVLKFMNLGS